MSSFLKSYLNITMLSKLRYLLQSDREEHIGNLCIWERNIYD